VRKTTLAHARLKRAKAAVRRRIGRRRGVVHGRIPSPFLHGPWRNSRRRDRSPGAGDRGGHPDVGPTTDRRHWRPSPTFHRVRSDRGRLCRAARRARPCRRCE
jgi:hypothetical protein